MDPATPLRPPDWHSGLEDNAACSRFDPSVPHPARVYAYWLGGKDHHRADREAAEEVMRRRPQVVAGARANRAFVARVVRYLTGECGIRQFLDIGTGLPAPDNTHEVAQAIAPDCRVVYVGYHREWFRSPNGGPLLARSPTLPIFTRAWPTLLPPGPDPSRQTLPPARAHC